MICTPVILADRFPPSTYDTPTSTCHVIIARAELGERPHGARARACPRPASMSRSWRCGG